MTLSKYKDISDIVHTFVLTLAILIGGWWTYKIFVLQREQYARAAITHEITSIPFPNDKTLLSVKMLITNSGTTLLSIRYATIDIQQIQPLQDLNLINEWKNKTDERIEGLWQILWPPLGRRVSTWRDGELEIEPGQQDEVIYDFILDTTMQVIQIYSWITNTQKFLEEGKPIGWSHRVDWCLQWGKDCVGKAAHAWCHYMRWTKATA